MLHYTITVCRITYRWYLPKHMSTVKLFQLACIVLYVSFLRLSCTYMCIHSYCDDNMYIQYHYRYMFILMVCEIEMFVVILIHTFVLFTRSVLKYWRLLVFYLGLEFYCYGVVYLDFSNSLSPCMLV